MKTLIIDTSSNNLILSILNGENIYKRVNTEGNRNHGAIINAEIESLLNDAKIELKDIDVFACCIGPGSFTGIRIGVSTVKGFNLAYNKLLIEVNSLEVNAYNISSTVDSVIDAGRGLYYYAKYKNNKCIILPCLVNTLEGLNNIAQFNENTDIVDNLISVVKQKLLRKEFVEKLSPLYIRKSQAEMEANI